MIPLAIGLALLGCAGLGAAPKPPPPPVPLDAPPPPPPKRTTLPPSPFDATDGWLGVVVASEGPAWAPKDGGAVVVPSPAGWDEVEEGATFHGLSADGPLALSFQGVRDVAWGCGTAVPAATFSASPAPSGGVVWIVQEESGAAAVRPTDARPPTAARRLYRLPFGGELDLRPGRSVVELGGARPFVDTYASGGVDLGREGAIGPTWPELAVTEGEESFVLVLRRNGAGEIGDEVAWEVVRIAGRLGTVAGSVRVAYGSCGD